MSLPSSIRILLEWTVLERGDIRVLGASADESTAIMRLTAKRSKRPTVSLHAARIDVERLAEGLIARGVFDVRDYWLDEQVFDGESVSTSLELGNDRLVKRDFWCGDGAADPRVRAVCEYVGEVLSPGSPYYPQEWAEFDAREQAQARRAAREQAIHTTRRREVWEAADRRLPDHGLRCPQCSHESRVHRAVPPQGSTCGYFICVRCARSFTADLG